MTLFDSQAITYLRSEAAIPALAYANQYTFTKTTYLTDIAHIRQRYPQYASVLIETTLLRRKAQQKLTGLINPTTGLFTRDALEQATAAPVACYRARRIHRSGLASTVHDITCSIGTELAALHRAGLQAVGSDNDPLRLQMAQHNLDSSVLLVHADASHPVSKAKIIIADPSRRSQGKRNFSPQDYSPTLTELLHRYRDRAFVIKCGPGIDLAYPELQTFPGEITFISWKGSLREATLWSPQLSQSTIQRRAVILDTAEEITNHSDDDCGVGPVGRWIINPDPAIIRAGLVRHWATRHHLWQLDPHIAYLTGDQLPPGIRGFEVIDHFPYQEKHLKQALCVHQCGSVEILVRGVEKIQEDPHKLRQRLILKGTQSLAVIITRLGKGHHSHIHTFVCRPSR